MCFFGCPFLLQLSVSFIQGDEGFCVAEPTTAQENSYIDLGLKNNLNFQFDSRGLFFDLTSTHTSFILINKS